MRCCCDTDPPSLRCANCDRANHQMCWDIIYPQVKRPKPPPADESQPYHLSIRERLIWVLVVAITMLTLAYVVTKLTR